jgi:diguanylate cyclase (GGDEF)-like protein
MEPAGPARSIGRLVGRLPRGRTLNDRLWQKRHRGMLLLLFAHLPALAVFALARANAPLHVAIEVLPVAGLAALAASPRLDRGARSALVAMGLLTCSALLVHIWDGRTEAHFHFFVVLSMLALDEDWVPYGLAVGYVLLHHGVLGVADPGSVYADADARRHPWTWALIHAAFIGGMVVVNVLNWRLNELSRARRRAIEAELHHRAHHDVLTGLPNRALLAQRLGAMIDQAEPGAGVAAIFVDLDDFKVINDSLGHESGDALLRAVAERLERVLRPDDVLARLGGDEFVVLLPRIPEQAHAERIADRLGSALRAPFVLDGEQRFMTASMGVATTDDAHAHPDALLRDADLAMYRAKDRGKARVEHFDAEMRRSAVERLEIETGLRTAVERDELRLVYQPEVDLATGRIVGAEALMRWEHPVHGLIPPDRFIPAAERSGVIIAMGAWAVREACRQAVAWCEETGEELTVAVNVSPRQLADDGFLAVVEDALAAAGLPPERLCLEVTESAVVADLEDAVAKLGALKSLGLHLAIDDFGVGHSSLSQLKYLVPVDTLKIDKSFIDGVTEGGEDEAIVRAVIELARSVGMTTVAEGVEQGDQADTLRLLDCGIGQGYHFARPQAAADVARLLRAGALGELAA